MNNLKFSKLILVNLVISSIIPLLISGPFFPDLIVSISSCVFIYYVVKKKDFKYFVNIPLIIFFCFCVYCILISLFVSENVLLSLESSLFYFRIGIFSCFIWYLIDTNKSVLNYFYYFLVISFLTLVIDGYSEYFLNKNFLGYIFIPNQVSSLFGDERIMGSYLSRLFPFLFALFIVKKKNKYEMYFIGLLFILVDILIFLSGERSAFFYLNLSTIIIILLIKNYQKFRILTFFIASIFIILLSSYNQTSYKRMIYEPFDNLIIQTFVDKKVDKKIIFFTSSHDSLIRTALNMFKDKPIFGHGPKMFREKCKKEEYATGITPCMTHPHNFYVQLLAETGVIGFSFLFSAFCYVLYCAYRQLKSIVLKKKRYLTDYQVCLLAGILISVWPFSPNGNFFNNWLAIIYSLPIGFYLHSVYGSNRKELV